MEKLMALYGISSPSGREGKMAKFIIEELKKMEIPFRQDRYGNIYAVKGNRESYPCVVAHMDEVHRRKTGSYAAHLVADSMIVGYDHKRKRMTGIGADDKNGIWICLKCLEDCKTVKCAFFGQEEVGCIGSSHADMSFFSDCRFVIQCDRKGRYGNTNQWDEALLQRVHFSYRFPEVRLQAGTGTEYRCGGFEKKRSGSILYQSFLWILRTSYGQRIYRRG